MPQTKNVRTLSKTVRLVPDSSFVTLTPAKLKKAIDAAFPENRERLTITKLNVLHTSKNYF